MSTPSSENKDNQALTSDEFVDKLRQALRTDGDFPASAKVVSELRRLVSDPKTTANQITELILREPSLGTRVLHLVNSSYYRRAKSIMTVSHAVVQIGMRPLAELCAGLVLLQKFIPVARKDGAFADCLKKTITTSLLASSITNEMASSQRNNQDETGYLAGTFLELGTLLLAFYFPQIYQSAIKRSEQKNQSLAKSIHELTGLTPTQLSIEVIDALQLPEFYKQVLQEAEISEKQEGSANKHSISHAVYAAKNISDVISSDNNKNGLESAIKNIERQASIQSDILHNVLGQLSEKFKEHCSSLELHLPELPEYVTSYSEEASDQESTTPEVASKENDDNFAQYVDEIRQAVDNREPTASVITTVMETFAWGLQFNRVLLLLMSSGKKALHGRMLLGQAEGLDAKNIKRPLGAQVDQFAPDNTAIKEARPVFRGDPILDNGWPFAVIPVGFGERAIGVIYADRVDTNHDELTSKEQAAIGVLAELLDRSITINA